jgi:hypothetical protein
MSPDIVFNPKDKDKEWNVCLVHTVVAAFWVVIGVIASFHSMLLLGIGFSLLGCVRYWGAYIEAKYATTGEVRYAARFWLFPPVFAWHLLRLRYTK